MSLILVAGAILFTRGLQNLKSINVGFNTSQLIRFPLNPMHAGYSQARIKAFAEQLRQALTTLPGVEDAAVVTKPILEDECAGGDLTVEGSPVQSDENGYLQNLVSPDFFHTMQIRMLAGRQLLASGSLPTSKVAVVNETFVKHFLPGRNPLGVHFGFGTGNKVQMDRTIIGVAADSQHGTLRSIIGPFVYLPYLATDDLSSLTFYVRSHGSEQATLSGIRRVVSGMDAGLPVNQLASLSEKHPCERR